MVVGLVTVEVDADVLEVEEVTVDADGMTIDRLVFSNVLPLAGSVIICVSLVVKYDGEKHSLDGVRLESGLDGGSKDPDDWIGDVTDTDPPVPEHDTFAASVAVAQLSTIAAPGPFFLE